MVVYIIITIMGVYTLKALLTEDFPVTSSILQAAQYADQEINKDNGVLWYLNLSIRICVGTLFALIVIPAVFIDSIVKVINIFNIKRENVMSFIEFVDAVPQGIKKIATAAALALVSIFILNIAASSVGLFLFGLKCLVAVSAVIYSIAVVKENQDNIWSAIELIQEKASNLAASCRAKASDFLSMFTFRTKKESAAPIMAGEQTPVEYTYFPNIPTFASVYENLPNNPFTCLFTQTTVNSQSLSGMTSSSTNPEHVTTNTVSDFKPPM